MIIPLFKKSKLRQILEKYNKLINSEIFQSIRRSEDELNKMFNEESEKCKWYEKCSDTEILDKKCNHKKGSVICDIYTCPLK